jgi:hypothetical protein
MSTMGQGLVQGCHLLLTYSDLLEAYVRYGVDHDKYVLLIAHSPIVRKIASSLPTKDCRSFSAFRTCNIDTILQTSNSLHSSNTHVCSEISADVCALVVISPCQACNTRPLRQHHLKRQYGVP